MQHVADGIFNLVDFLDILLRCVMVGLTGKALRQQRMLRNQSEES